VPAKEFGNFKRWRFYDGRKWRRDWRASAPLADRFANEFSVSFNRRLRKYVAVHTPDGISPEIAVRTAPTPVGPWSAAQAVFTCPESKWGPKLICYAAKGHPEISGPNELIVSYIASSTDFWQMAADSRLYRPRFVRLQF
jgi:hypothetical protein